MSGSNKFMLHTLKPWTVPVTYDGILIIFKWVCLKTFFFCPDPIEFVKNWTLGEDDKFFLGWLDPTELLKKWTLILFEHQVFLSSPCLDLWRIGVCIFWTPNHSLSWPFCPQDRLHFFIKSSEPAPTNAPVGCSVHGMGCIFSSNLN